MSECPKHHEGGLRHEYIFCHCDVASAEKNGYEKGREEKEKEFALRLIEKDFQRQEVWNEAIEVSVKVAEDFSERCACGGCTQAIADKLKGLKK